MILFIHVTMKVCLKIHLAHLGMAHAKKKIMLGLILWCFSFNCESTAMISFMVRVT